ncbi:hypothetical protein JOC34_000632 [Virgibacillus halotolerans]|uniref:hypothetical protein n=1 Tax=Virgibacillus halotolerans TaxID=1071053 RepID=UPI001960E4E1|nr:hypothetical protein [Virgibacillus halotolerans]MBM7598275.1 hypothetical protein [Virgibacillus halotolerans]
MIETMSLTGGLDIYSFGERYQSDKSPQGRKVRFRNKGGWESDTEYAHKYLINEGDILTVEEIYVGRSSSEAEFKEHPNITFNTVMFEDVSEMPLGFISAKMDTTNYRKGKVENQIQFQDTTIEADDFGRVLINGKQVRDVDDAQEMFNEE